MNNNLSNNKRIAKNTLMLYIRMLLIMVVTLYTSRVVLNVLGVEDYGIYNVVGGVISMLSFFNSSLNVATQRFLNFEMGRNNYKGVQRVFSISFISYSVIAFIIFIIAESIGLWFIKNKLVIPFERLDIAILVFHFSVLTFIVNLLTIPYNALIIAHEKMSIYAFISIGEAVIKLLLVFLLSQIDTDKLGLYAFMVFIATCIITLSYRICCRKLFKESKLIWMWDRKLIKELFSFSGWMLSGTITSLLSTQGVNILINIFFGPVFNAARAIAVQVNTAVGTFSMNFMMAVRPQIIKSYAQKDFCYMYTLVFNSSKYAFFLLLILVLPLLLNTEYILGLWLGSIPQYTILFTQLILIDLLINTMYSPIAYVSQAAGKVKEYQLTISIGFLLITALTWLAFYKKLPAYYTFLISIFVNVLGLIARLVVMYVIIHFPIKEYIKKIITPLILISIISFPISYIPKLYFHIDNLKDFVLYTIWIACMILITVWFVGLSSKEKNFISKKLRQILK